MSSLSIICYKNGLSYVNIPVKLEDIKDKEENKCCKCCCQKAGEIKESRIGYLPTNVVDGSISLDAEDGNNNDVRILSVQKAETENEYSTLIKPTGKFSIQSLLIANIGRQVQLSCGFGNALIGRIKAVWQGSLDEDKTDIPSPIGNDSFVIIESSSSSGEKAEILKNISKIEDVSGVPEEYLDDKEGKLGTELMVKYQTNGDSDEARANLSYMAFDHVTWTPRYNILINPDVKTLKCEAKACIQCQNIFEDEITFPELVLTGSKTEIKKTVDSFLEKKEKDTDEEESTKERRSSSSSLFDLLFSPKEPLKTEFTLGYNKMMVAVDMFEYSLKNVTLKKDHPVQVDMIEPIKTGNYHNVYHIDLGKTEVRKALMFKNETNHPLTSGPVTIVEKSKEQRRFLENGNLSFTKPGENVVIKTTPCMDVLLKVKQEKKELKCEKVWERTLKRKEMTITVDLENTLKTEASCVLEYSAPGSLVSSDPPVSSVLRSPHMAQHDLTAVTRYTWDLELGAAEVRQMTIVMVRTSDTSEEDTEPPPDIYN